MTRSASSTLRESNPAQLERELGPSTSRRRPRRSSRPRAERVPSVTPSSCHQASSSGTRGFAQRIPSIIGRALDLVAPSRQADVGCLADPVGEVQPVGRAGHSANRNRSMAWLRPVAMSRWTSVVGKQCSISAFPNPAGLAHQHAGRGIACNPELERLADGRCRPHVLQADLGCHRGWRGRLDEDRRRRRDRRTDHDALDLELTIEVTARRIPRSPRDVASTSTTSPAWTLRVAPIIGTTSACSPRPTPHTR